MRILRLSMQFAAFIMLFNFLACTSTKFSTVWKDETYQGHPTKILVINTFNDHHFRRLFEDEMVKALKDHKVDAVINYAVVPTDKIVSDKDFIAQQAEEVGADTVLITGPSVETSRSTVYINTRTDVYDIKSNKLISFVSAETQIHRDLQQYFNEVPSYVKDLVNKLSEAGLF